MFSIKIYHGASAISRKGLFIQVNKWNYGIIKAAFWEKSNFFLCFFLSDVKCLHKPALRLGSRDDRIIYSRPTDAECHDLHDLQSRTDQFYRIFLLGMGKVGVAHGKLDVTMA
jgi:hypothetical protein